MPGREQSMFVIKGSLNAFPVILIPQSYTYNFNQMLIVWTIINSMTLMK